MKKPISTNKVGNTIMFVLNSNFIKEFNELLESVDKHSKSTVIARIKAIDKANL